MEPPVLSRPGAQPTSDVLIAGAVLALVAGIALRLWGLSSLPGGLYQDEAFYALDAVSLSQGECCPLFFPANNGREPLYIYLMSATISLFGPTALGARAASAAIGLAGLGVAFWLGQAWIGGRGGWWVMGILAGLLWHIHLSHVAFRAGLLPLLSGFGLALAADGLRRQQRSLLIGAGVMLGLSFYSYSAARFVPMALALMLIYGLIWQRQWLGQRWRDLAWIALPALLISLPLAWLALSQPGMVLGRSGQVGIWNAQINQGDLIGTAWHSLIGALGMFTWRGDDIWRHNVPTRPVFDPLMSVFFLAGVLLAIKDWGRRPGPALALIWTAIMLLPTALAEDAPHFLRAVGVLPVVVLLPAYALDQAWHLLEHSTLKPAVLRVLLVMLAGLPLISAGLAAVDYFGCSLAAWPRLSGYTYQGCYQTDPVRGYFFQQQAAELARDLQGQPWITYLDSRLWDTFAAVRYLLAESPQVQLYTTGDALPQLAPGQSIIAWPFDDLAPVYAALPPHTAIAVQVGPPTRGDLEKSTYPLYVRWQVAHLPPAAPECPAYFTGGLVLSHIAIVEQAQALSVEAGFSVEAPAPAAQLFIHLADPADGTLLAQADMPLGGGFYAPLSWPQGSVMIQRVTLRKPADGEITLLLGLYDPATGQRYSVDTAAFQVRDQAVVLPVSGTCEGESGKRSY